MHGYRTRNGPGRRYKPSVASSSTSVTMRVSVVVALLFCAVSLCAAFTSPAVAFSKPALRSTSSAVRSARVAPLRMNAGIEVIFALVV